jgi:hypothetical protein
MIPKQFAAVRIELVCTVGLITSDNEYPFSTVGKARAENVARKPDPQIPDLFDFVDNCLKVGPLMGAEEARHIFKDNPPRSALSNKPRKLVEETASRSAKSVSPRVRGAEVLARPPGRPEISFRDVFRFEGLDVAMKGHLRPMTFEDGLTIGVDLAVKLRVKTREACLCHNDFHSPREPGT